MVNYFKRTLEIISGRGVKYLIIYSFDLLKKIHAQQKKIRYIKKYHSKVSRLGGLIDVHDSSYWWSREGFDKVASLKLRDFWGETKDWVYSDLYPERSEIMHTFIKENFWFHLNKTDCAAEVACATGSLTLKTAKYVAHIEGFEYSQFMVNQAREEAARSGVTNISFTQFDATKQKLPKCYDAISILGLFTCLLDDDVVEEIVKNLSNSIKNDGYLLLKDSYHETPGEKALLSIYCYNYHSGYKAVYRSKTAFFGLMKKYGFHLEKEACLTQNENYPFNYCSVISAWKKQAT